jgi:hypothetical protein
VLTNIRLYFFWEAWGLRISRRPIKTSACCGGGGGCAAGFQFCNVVILNRRGSPLHFSNNKQPLPIASSRQSIFSQVKNGLLSFLFFLSGSAAIRQHF